MQLLKEIVHIYCIPVLLYSHCIDVKFV